MKHIVVLGSTNTDMVVTGQKIPVPGETVTGGRFLMNPGGKGANQAVAVARLASENTRCVFIAKNLSRRNKYVRSATLNGKPLEGPVIRHADIVAGGELVFEMER